MRDLDGCRYKELFFFINSIDVFVIVGEWVCLLSRMNRTFNIFGSVSGFKELTLFVNG